MRIYQHAKDVAHARAFLEGVFPRLAAWHAYLYRERDPEGEGLVYIRHPWESGMDNSPMWDEIMLRLFLRPDEIPSYQRVDTELIPIGDRPVSTAYDRFAWLIQFFAARDFDEARIRESCPFLVQDVLFNTILCQANRDLAGIARVLEDKTTVEKPRQGRRGFSLFRVFGLSIVDLGVSRPGLEPGT